MHDCFPPSVHPFFTSHGLRHTPLSLSYAASSLYFGWISHVSWCPHMATLLVLFGSYTWQWASSCRDPFFMLLSSGSPIQAIHVWLPHRSAWTLAVHIRPPICALLILQRLNSNIRLGPHLFHVYPLNYLGSDMPASPAGSYSSTYLGSETPG